MQRYSSENYLFFRKSFCLVLHYWHNMDIYNVIQYETVSISGIYSFDLLELISFSLFLENKRNHIKEGQLNCNRTFINIDIKFLEGS